MSRIQPGVVGFDFQGGDLVQPHQIDQVDRSLMPEQAHRVRERRRRNLIGGTEHLAAEFDDGRFLGPRSVKGLQNLMASTTAKSTLAAPSYRL